MANYALVSQGDKIYETPNIIDAKITLQAINELQKYNDSSKYSITIKTDEEIQLYEIE